MSYVTQSQLAFDNEFVSRGQMAIYQQAEIFRNAAALDQKALADSILVSNVNAMFTFQMTLAVAPGFDTQVDTGDGTIDSSNVTDAEILTVVQTEWPAISALYFNEDGTPHATH